MNTRIRSFRRDETERDSWIAELECGHTQHVRHNPVMSPRPWVLTEEGRQRFVGVEVRCRQCEEEIGSRCDSPPSS